MLNAVLWVRLRGDGELRFAAGPLYAPHPCQVQAQPEVGGSALAGVLASGLAAGVRPAAGDILSHADRLWRIEVVAPGPANDTYRLQVSAWSGD